MPLKQLPASTVECFSLGAGEQQRSAASAKPKRVMDKVFKIAPDQIAHLVTDQRGCFATDRITVEGAKVGYMYREEPGEEWDSGWRFMAGDESDAYVNDPSNLQIYALNTIANYDREIIPLLAEPINSAFARDPVTRSFVQVQFEPA